MQPIWEVALQILFYASPIIYTSQTFPANIRTEAMASPLAAILTQMRHAFIDPAANSAAQEIGGEVRLLIPLAIVLGVFALGLWVFMREAPRIAEEL